TAYFIQKFKDKRYILNGLLIGGAVGAGFAVFETAGYVFQSALIPFNYEGVTTFLFNPNPTSPLSTAIFRGMLAFGGHVAWAAVTGAGLMMALKNQKVFSWNAIWSG
ncbi:PrsW family glutamic-type intramembrane protease, partial [[Eubacterium] siraeum]|nr:PrsW family glutamic-type intramembrane protease [[Eubacterium] siraeum]